MAKYYEHQNNSNYMLWLMTFIQKSARPIPQPFVNTGRARIAIKFTRTSGCLSQRVSQQKKELYAIKG